MEEDFKILRQSRLNFIKLLDSLPFNKIIKIPSGFSNTIFWNAAHVMVTQQLLLYYLSGNQMNLDKDWIELYKKGTKVEYKPTKEDLMELKELMISTVDKFEEDYKKGIFKNYNPYETSYGFTLNSIEDAIKFNNIHEGLHLGYAMAMKKIV